MTAQLILVLLLLRSNNIYGQRYTLIQQAAATHEMSHTCILQCYPAPCAQQLFSTCIHYAVLVWLWYQSRDTNDLK